MKLYVTHPELKPYMFNVTQYMGRVFKGLFKITAITKDSFSHRTGVSFDIAPVIAGASRAYYSHYNYSDPVLFARRFVLSRLRKFKRLAMNHVNKFMPPAHDMLIVVENNHFHITYLPSDGRHPRISLYTYPRVHPAYGDSLGRYNMIKLKNL